MSYDGSGLGDTTQDTITALSVQIDALDTQLAFEQPGSASYASIKAQLASLNNQRALLQGQATTSDQPSSFMLSLSNLGSQLTAGLDALPTLAKWGAIGLAAFFGLKVIGVVKGRRARG